MSHGASKIPTARKDLSRADWDEDNKAIQLGKSKSLSHVEPSYNYRHKAAHQNPCCEICWTPRSKEKNG